MRRDRRGKRNRRSRAPMPVIEPPAAIQPLVCQWFPSVGRRADRPGFSGKAHDLQQECPHLSCPFPRQLRVSPMVRASDAPYAPAYSTRSLKRRVQSRIERRSDRMTRDGILTRSTWLAHACFVRVLAVSMGSATIAPTPAARPTAATRSADDASLGVDAGRAIEPFEHAILHGWDAQPSAPI